jgi:acyl-CoA hydrolase
MVDEQEQLPTRFIDETEVRMAELMTPELANFAGNVHGGAILSQMDKVAYVCACRYAGADTVTVSVDHVEFREPVLVGELLHFKARVIQVGRSSMDIEIIVESQDIRHGTLRHTNTCYFTMVARREGKSVAVPKLAARTPEDELRLQFGQVLREERALFRKRFDELLAHQPVLG